MTSLSFLIQLLLSHDWHKINFSKLMWTGESHNHCQNNQPSLWNNDLKWLLNISQIYPKRKENWLQLLQHIKYHLLCYQITMNPTHLSNRCLNAASFIMPFHHQCAATVCNHKLPYSVGLMVLEKNRQLFSLHLNWYCCW